MRVISNFTKKGRELQELLGSTKNHTSWVKQQVKNLGLVEGSDFTPQRVKNAGAKGRPKLVYHFTEAAAHKIADRTEVKTEVTAMVKDNFTTKAMTAGN